MLSIMTQKNYQVVTQDCLVTFNPNKMKAFLLTNQHILELQKIIDFETSISEWHGLICKQVIFI